MTQARVSVFLPVDNTFCVHVLLIEVDRSLEWIKTHADEIAAKAVSPRYVALNVEATS